MGRPEENMTMRIALAGLALAFATAAHAQLPDPKTYAAKTEIYAIASLTLTDEQFLKGDAAAGKPVTVTGHLRIAQGQGRLPVVVLVHGSGGMGPNIETWSREFNAMGISTFALDGFTGRGLASVNTDQSALGRLNMILDAYRVLDILARHPRVDPSRIALMGFSRGGQGTLYASVKRFHQAWNKSGIEFAAYVPFYPDCMTTYRGDTEVADRPIRIFQGTPDDYNPVAPCKAFVARLRAAGRDVTLTEYPNAAHAFDNPLGPVPPVALKGAQTVRQCRIREDDAGVLMNTATGAPFTYKDACVETGPHVGYDAVATEAARASVRDFLRTVLKLP
jgi:dienelactone hydrolase